LKLPMDPVSAVGLASSIITFVDFSWKLIAGSLEIYRSLDGSLQENARLEDVIDDLDSIAEDLEKTTSGRTKSERAIRRLAEECRSDAKVLLDILKQLKVPKRSIWKSVYAKWRALRKREEVRDLKERLQEYRGEILINLTLLLR